MFFFSFSCFIFFSYFSISASQANCCQFIRAFLPLSDWIRLFKLDCDEELKLCMIRMFECDDNVNRLSGYAGRVHHLNDCSNEMYVLVLGFLRRSLYSRRNSDEMQLFCRLRVSTQAICTEMFMRRYTNIWVELHEWRHSGEGIVFVYSQ